MQVCYSSGHHRRVLKERGLVDASVDDGVEKALFIGDAEHVQRLKKEELWNSSGLRFIVITFIAIK